MNHKFRNISAMAIILLLLLGLASPGALAQAAGRTQPNDFTRVVLLEMFTATWCGPCAATAPFVDATYEQYGPSQVVLLRNQVYTDGLDTPETNARASFYGVPGVPTMQIDGTIQRVGSEDIPAYLVGDINNERTRSAPITIAANSEFSQDGTTITTTAQVQTTGTVGFSNVRLFFVLNEYNVYYDGGNGELYHDFVVRKYMPDVNGFSINPNQPGTYSQSFNLQSGWSRPNLRVAVFAQDIPTKEILQAVYTDPPDIDEVTFTNLPATQDANAHSSFSYTVQATSSFGNPITYSVVSGPGTINPTTGLYNWSDPQGGRHLVRIRATSSAGPYREADLTIQVKDVPAVGTQEATGVGSTAANLNGWVVPNGLSTDGWFEWGTTPTYGNQTAKKNRGSGYSEVIMFEKVTSLSPGTTYHFRAAAQNARGISYGIDKTFTTTIPHIVQLTNLPATRSPTLHQPFSFTVTATDNFGHALTYSLLSGPGSINPNSGLYTWNDPSPMGTSTAYVRVTCSQGALDQKALTLTVTAPLPVVATIGAGSLTPSRALLEGSIDPKGLTAECWFDWGTGTGYSQSTVHQAIGSATATFTAQLEGLTADTLYHFRAAGQTEAGVRYGEDHTFSTPLEDGVTLQNLPRTVTVTLYQAMTTPISAVDTYGHSLTYAILSGPGAIDPASGLYSWDDPQPLGTSTVLVRATCSEGASDQKMLSVVVSESGTQSFNFSLLTGWNMVSMPLVVDPDPVVAFQSWPPGWQIFWWDAAQASYRVQGQFVLQAGAGYWVKVGSNQENSISGQVLGDNTRKLLLVPGWNMVGFPFLGSESWGQVRIEKGGQSYTLDAAFAAGILVGDIFSWNGLGYDRTRTAGAFQAGRGYWVKCGQGCEMVFQRNP